MEVLCALAAREGQVVGRAELINAIWSERFGADESLSRAISILRKAFDGKPYIETVPKRGYCLTAPVTAVAVEPDMAPGGKESPEPVGRTPGRRRPLLMALGMVAVVAVSIVAVLWWQAATTVGNRVAIGRVEVLPFDILTDDPAARRFSAGLDSNLRRALAVGGVEAAAGVRSAAEDISRPLAELTLEGSVDRDPDRLLVTAHIVDQEERVVLWSSEFRRDTKEMIDLQSEIASQVAQVMRCGLASRGVQPERTTTDVFAMFLQACNYAGSGVEEGVFKLHELARRMVAAAPDLAMAQALYAVASVSMAQIVRHQGFVAAAENHIADGRSAAERALRIDPDNGTANCALAWTYSRAPAHWIQFETYLRRIDEADASFPYALHDLTWLARATGRLGDAVNLNRRAAELDPYSPFKTTALAWQLAMAGRLPEADVLLTRSEALWPNARAVADYRLQIATWYRPPDAAEEVLRSSAIGISDSEVACLSLLLDARRGHRVEHQHLRRTCAGAVRADYVPRVLAILGDVDEAFRELDVIDFSGGLADTIPLFFPELRAVRHDPRFMPLALRIGLVDYWLNTDRWPDFCADPDLPYDCKQIAASLIETRGHAGATSGR